MVQISSFKNTFNHSELIQEVFFETKEKEIFSFFIKSENSWYHFWEYSIIESKDQPNQNDEIFFTQYKNDNKIVSFLSKQEFDDSLIPFCQIEYSTKIIYAIICIIFLLSVILFIKIFRKTP